MRYAFSLSRRAAFGVAAGTLAAGGLLFTAGVLVGASAAPGETSALMAADVSASSAADSAGGLPELRAPAADCPPVPAEAAGSTSVAPSSSSPPSSSPGSSSAPGAGFSAAEFSTGARASAGAAETYRDERRALAAMHRFESRGVEAVIEAWAGPDGEPVFRVVPGGAP